ncbi:MBL fold metallo-hydrolase [Nonomuraea thailandensis]
MITHPELLERGHPFRQWKTWRLPGTRLTLTGYSRAADKTFFHIPELKLALDAGLAEGRQADTVLLTHTHLDHAKDLDFLATRPTGVDIHVPEQALPYVRHYLRATTELNQSAAYDATLAAGAACTAYGPARSSPSAGTPPTRCASCTPSTRCPAPATASPRTGEPSCRRPNSSRRASAPPSSAGSSPSAAGAASPSTGRSSGPCSPTSATPTPTPCPATRPWPNTP